MIGVAQERLQNIDCGLYGLYFALKGMEYIHINV